MKTHLLLAAALFTGCVDDDRPRSPTTMTQSIPAYQKTLQWAVKDYVADCQEYSVRLSDMSEHPYQHRYRISCGHLGAAQPGVPQGVVFNEIDTGWLPVAYSLFRKHKYDLDRTVLTRSRTGVIRAVSQPPGYSYVGNSAYGRWQTDPYGKMRWIYFSAAMAAMYTAPVYRHDYDNYLDYRRSGRVYYSPSYRTRVQKRYPKRPPTYYSGLKTYRSSKPTTNYQKVPDIRTKYKAKKTAKERANALNRVGKSPKSPLATKTTKPFGIKSKAAPTKPLGKPLSFKDRLAKKKAGEGRVANASGYGVKTTSKYEAANKKQVKKKKSVFGFPKRKKVSRPTYKAPKRKSSSRKRR